MIQKGFVSQECFNILHAECYDSSLSSKETREFLIALNLATPLPDLSSLYIPSLISGENQACVRKEMRTMEVNPDALAFYYSFKKSESVSIVQLVQQASLKVGLQRVLLRIPKCWDHIPCEFCRQNRGEEPWSHSSNEGHFQVDNGVEEHPNRLYHHRGRQHCFGPEICSFQGKSRSLIYK